MKDYYSILSVKQDASYDEIKKSFRALALQLHPDKNKAADAHEKFIEIHEAFQILSDKTKRAKYDSFYNYSVLNKKRFKKPTDIDINNFETWATESKKQGHRYAQSNINIFINEIFTDLGSELAFRGILEGLGTIIESASESLGDFFDVD